MSRGRKQDRNEKRREEAEEQAEGRGKSVPSIPSMVNGQWTMVMAMVMAMAMDMTGQAQQGECERKTHTTQNIH